MAKVTVIGAGLAGSEAAWQIANAGVQVDLYEMRPKVMTPAHHTGLFAELVCSNSLRANNIENAAGLLKEEMRRLNSLVMKAADATPVPAGGALAVDRDSFSQYITNALAAHPKINIINSEVKELPEDRPLIIATGPLTSEHLAHSISSLTGKESLYFYDAAAPIVTVESLDFEKIYFASRYGKRAQMPEKSEDEKTEGEPGRDYLNCPMDKAQYETFWQELVKAQAVPLKEFEKPVFFEGCMPIEEMAGRGIDTMRFGPLKPVGLENPQTGERPYAVVQLRQDNYAATLYNIVGFQTHLKWSEQKRVFSLIPGLENAEFVRFGVMHRNTFINSPQILRPTLQMNEFDDIFFAGQITGVEGYIESAACGLAAGINAAAFITGCPPVVFPPETAHGALCRYVSSANSKFQPMNINFGLLPPLEGKIKDKKLKNSLIAQRALSEIEKFKKFVCTVAHF